MVGTVDQFRSKAAVQKAIETRRININEETWQPSTIEQLVSHYLHKELREGGLKQGAFDATGLPELHKDADSTGVGLAFAFRGKNGSG